MRTTIDRRLAALETKKLLGPRWSAEEEEASARALVEYLEARQRGDHPSMPRALPSSPEDHERAAAFIRQLEVRCGNA